MQLTTAHHAAMHALAWPGLDHRKSISRKLAVSTTSVTLMLPKNELGKLPSLVRFSALDNPPGTVYAKVGGDLAVVPTTSTDGSALLRDRDVIAPWGADRISFVSEGNQTVTLSYYWD